jgi:hypothetical protein
MQLATRHVAAEHATIRATTHPNVVDISIRSPFDTDVISVSFALPWPSDHPRVLVNNKLLRRVDNAAQLRAYTWMQHGFHATVSIPLSANAESRLYIERFHK